jgi:hypothetical protein
METHVIEKISRPITEISLPKLQSAYPQARSKGRIVSTRVVGVSFDNRQEVIARLQIGDKVWLEREPDNPHDPNAIKVSRSNSDQIGYINRHLAASLAPFFDAYGYPVKAKVRFLTGSEFDGYRLGVVIAFKLPKPKRTNQGLAFECWED